VAALDSALAAPAAPHAYPEPGDDGAHLGQFGLELLGPPFEIEPVTTVRAALRQRGVKAAVGLSRRCPVAVTAVALALLAARGVPLVLRLALGERGRLAFGGATDLFQEPLQLGDTGLDLAQALVQPRVLVRQPRVLGRQLVVGRQRPAGLGRSQIGRRLRRADPPSYTTRVSRWWTPLNKYA